MAHYNNEHSKLKMEVQKLKAKSIASTDNGNKMQLLTNELNTLKKEVQELKAKSIPNSDDRNQNMRCDCDDSRVLNLTNKTIQQFKSNVQRCDTSHDIFKGDTEISYKETP